MMHMPMIRYGRVRYGAVRCGAVRCGAVRCGTMRYDVVRYDDPHPVEGVRGLVRHDAVEGDLALSFCSLGF